MAQDARQSGAGLTSAKMLDCRWLKPNLVGQFEYVEWTPDNHLRHSRFIGLRDDKKASVQGFSNNPDIIPSSARHWVGPRTVDGSCPKGVPCSRLYGLHQGHARLQYFALKPASAIGQ